MAKLELRCKIRKEGNWYVANIIGSNLVSQGKTKRSALKNVLEAYKLSKEA